jgi:hypothetical protein
MHDVGSAQENGHIYLMLFLNIYNFKLTVHIMCCFQDYPFKDCLPHGYKLVLPGKGAIAGAK